jgi:hypothetical protein
MLNRSIHAKAHRHFLRSRRHDLAPEKGAAGHLRNNRAGNMTSSRQSVGNWKCKAVLCR